MGMSASQGRLLFLTARLSDLEFQAQCISNAKIRLAENSSEVAREYEQSLNKQKITVYACAEEGSPAYIDATAYNLTTYGAISTLDKQRFLVDSGDRVLVNSEVADAYSGAMGRTINVDGQQTTAEQIQASYGSLEAYLRAKLGYSSEMESTELNLSYDAKRVTYYTDCYYGKEAFLNNLGYTANNENEDEELIYDKGALIYNTNVFDRIAKNGYNMIPDSSMTDSEWLYQQLNSGNIFLETQNRNNIKGRCISSNLDEWVKVSWSSGDSSLKTERDKSDEAQAEATYNSKMAQIQAKDKRYDLDLRNIDTQHNAIQTELETVKKVIDKNIDRSFKIFEA